MSFVKKCISVSGYATREICFGDESHDDCPPDTTPPKVETPIPEKTRKYKVRGGKDLTSKFEKRMLEREKTEKIRIANAEKEKKLQEQLLKEKPKEDELHGRRIHTWILGQILYKFAFINN